MKELIKPQEKLSVEFYPSRLVELVEDLSKGLDECREEMVYQLVDIAYRCGYLDGLHCMYKMGDNIL